MRLLPDVGRALAPRDRGRGGICPVSGSGGPLPRGRSQALRRGGSAPRAGWSLVRRRRGDVSHARPCAGRRLLVVVLPARARLLGRQRVALRRGGESSWPTLPAHPLGLGPARRATRRARDRWRVPARPRVDLRRGICLAVATARRTRRPRWHLSRRRIPRPRAGAGRAGGPMVVSDALLARTGRRHAARALRPRHLGRRQSRGRLRDDAGADRRLGVVSLARHRVPGFSLVPVGLALAGNRFPRAVPLPSALGRESLRRAPGARRNPPPPLAALSSDVLLGGGEALERRSGVALAHRAPISLSNPAAAAVDRLVCPPSADRLPEGLGRDDVPDRRLGAVLDLRAAPDSLRRGGDDGGPSGNHPPHG